MATAGRSDETVTDSLRRPGSPSLRGTFSDDYYRDMNAPCVSTRIEDKRLGSRSEVGGSSETPVATR